MDARPLVVTLGDLVLDVTCRVHGEVRDDTDTPAEVVVDAGGQAANAAAWAVQAGARARLVVRRAADPVGRLAEERISARGVEVRGPRGPVGGGTIVVLVADDGRRDMLSDRGAATTLAADELPPDLADRAGAVLLAGYALLTEPMLGAARRLAALGRGAGALVAAELSSVTLIDAVGPEAFATRIASLDPDLVLGTTAEHERLGGPDAALRLAPAAVEKRGALGARLHRRDADPFDVAAAPAAVVDTTGAGDALAGALLATLAAGASLPAALTAAMPYAARCVARVGSLPPARVEADVAEDGHAILPGPGTPGART